MIALYFLSNSKASVKAQYISALFYAYGRENVAQGKFKDGVMKLEGVSEIMLKDIINRDRTMYRENEI